MPFVKLDCNMLNSTLWFERIAREIFITALLMAEPYETSEELPQISIRSLDDTGWKVPAGRYGFVAAAGIGIIRRAMLSDEEKEIGLDALEMLGSPESASRTSEFEGRRLVRVNGGFIVLNFQKYRDRDYTAAKRAKRYRERKKRHTVTSLRHGVSTTNVTQGEAEGEGEAKAKKKKHPLLSEVCVYAHKIGLDDKEAEKFCDYYISNGWKVGRNPMQDWHAALRNWRKGIKVENNGQLQFSPQHRQNRINLLNERKQKINRTITDPNNPPSWAVNELSEIDEELQQL